MIYMTSCIHKTPSSITIYHVHKENKTTLLVNVECWQARAISFSSSFFVSKRKNTSAVNVHIKTLSSQSLQQHQRCYYARNLWSPWNGTLFESSPRLTTKGQHRPPKSTMWVTWHFSVPVFQTWSAPTSEDYPQCDLLFSSIFLFGSSKDSSGVRSSLSDRRM